MARAGCPPREKTARGWGGRSADGTQVGDEVSYARNPASAYFLCSTRYSALAHRIIYKAGEGSSAPRLSRSSPPRSSHLIPPGILLERLQRRREQIMPLGVRQRFLKLVGTGEGEVAQGRIVPTEMVVDAMPLDVRVELAQLA